MAKKIKGVTPSPSEPLEDLDLDETLPPLEDGAKQPPPKDSTVNLDEYGIWVKAEPEDFRAEESFDDQAMELEDLSPDEAGKEPNQESEAGMIDDLDIPEEESLPGLEEAGGEESLTLESEPVPAAKAGGEASAEDAGAEEIPALDEELTISEELPGDEELTIGEALAPLEEEPADQETAEVETVLREAESAAETPAAEAASVSEEAAPSQAEAGGDFEEVSLDDLGIEISHEVPEEETAKITVKRKPTTPPPTAAPSTVASGADEATPHIIDDEFASLSLDLEGEGEGETEAPAAEKGGLELEELELPAEEPLAEEPAAKEPVAAGAAGTEEFEDLTGPETLEEIPELELGGEEPAELDLGKEEAGEEIEVPLSEGVAIAESEEELGGLETAADKTAGASASVLKSIEAELKSIKFELTQLKAELGVLRGRKAEGPAAGRKPGKAGAEAGGDFFEEEEDETIALTGEELDNILTTADIKEEAKPAPAETGEEPTETELDLGEDIIGYEEPAAPETPPAAEPEAEAIHLDEVEGEEAAVVKGSGAPEGEIEIEIPELETGAAETPSAETLGDLEAVEELGPEEGLESPAAPALEDTLEEVGELELEPAAETSPPLAPAAASAGAKADMQLPSGLKEEIKSVLGYMDHLLESLPEEKIEEFAKSEYFSIYKKLFEELGLVS
jgi:pilus assembly protein FimV